MTNSPDTSLQYNVDTCFYELLKRRRGSVGGIGATLKYGLAVLPLIFMFLSLALSRSVYGIMAGFAVIIFIIGPVIIVIMDFIIYLPKLTKFDGFDDILATPLNDTVIFKSIERIGNELIKGHLLPLVISFWFVPLFMLLFSLGRDIVFIIAIPLYVLWLIFRKFALSVGLIIAFMPRKVRGFGTIFCWLPLYTTVLIIVVSGLSLLMVSYSTQTASTVFYSGTIVFAMYLNAFIVLGVSAWFASSWVQRVFQERRRGELY